MPPISFTLITNDAENAKKVIASCGPIYREGDEWLVLDTSGEGLELPGCRVLHRPDLLVDYTPYVDKWLPEKAKEFAKLYPDPRMIIDFSHAREITRREAKHPICFWIDSDDVLDGRDAGKLREKVEGCMGRLDAVFMDYAYAFDEHGQCTTTLRRERFFFRDRYHWKGRCHETAIPQPDIDPPARTVGLVNDLDVRIRHTDARKPPGVSDFRNYVILRKELEEEGESVDPRTIFYLGNAARGLRRLKESLALYGQFQRYSGSKDDLFASVYYSGSMYLDPEIQRPHDAKDCFLRCVDLDPGDPRGYYGVARCLAALERHEEALQWYFQGRQKRLASNHVFSYDPTQLDVQAHVMAAISAKELDKPDLIADCLSRIKTSNKEIMQSVRHDIQTIGANYGLTQSVVAVLNSLSHGGPNALRVGKEICAELAHVPEPLEKLGISAREEPDPREEKPNLAIFCGETPEYWGPKSRVWGTGGSEKMVLLLSGALQRNSPWNVSVYAKVARESRGVDDHGVLWRHWAEFDETLPRDVLVAWRNPAAISIPCPARLRVLWNHDVQNPSTYDDKLLALLDYAQFQSRFHASPVPADVPRWMARNAIELYQTKHAPRDPKRVIYASSPDRGLHTFLRIIAKARETDPEINAHVLYGFTPFARKCYASQRQRFLPDMGHEMDTTLYEKEVHRLIDVVEAQLSHRVGFGEVYLALLSAGVWLYPTRFWEISCMAAMEAQAFGLVPLATRKAALAETILPYATTLAPPLPELPEHGEASEEWVETAAEMLVEAVKVPAEDSRRLKLAKMAWDAYSIDALAEEWKRKLARSSSGCGGTKGAKGSCVGAGSASLKS